MKSILRMQIGREIIHLKIMNIWIWILHVCVGCINTNIQASHHACSLLQCLSAGDDESEPVRLLYPSITLISTVTQRQPVQVLMLEWFQVKSNRSVGSRLPTYSAEIIFSVTISIRNSTLQIETTRWCFYTALQWAPKFKGIVYLKIINHSPFLSKTIWMRCRKGDIFQNALFF